nr:hypothetical protein [Tanacetum cinerariifolium]
NPKGERFLIASRFPTPPLVCAFFIPRATMTTNVVNAPSEPFVVKQDHGVNPPHIDECCCECGEALDGIICQQCAYKSCGKGAMLNMVTTINLKLRLSIRNRVTVKTLIPRKTFTIINNNISVVINVGARTRLFNELAEFINSPSWNRPAVYDDDDDVDYNIAITPVLSTKEPGNSLSMGDEHLDTILATESDEVIKSSVKDLVPIPSKFKALQDNPTPSSEFLTKSSSISPKPFLEETNTFHNSLPEFENFCFDLE